MFPSHAWLLLPCSLSRVDSDSEDVQVSGKTTLCKTPQEACHGLQFPFAWDSSPNRWQRQVAMFRPGTCKGRSPNITEIPVGRSYCSYSFLSSCDLSVKARGTALLLPPCHGGGRAGRRAELQNQTLWGHSLQIPTYGRESNAFII